MARYIDADKLKGMFNGARPVGCAMHQIIDEVPTADVAPRAEVAREIFQEIYADLFRMLPLKVFRLISGDIVGDRFDAGKERALHDVIHCVAELEKKYTEGQK